VGGRYFVIAVAIACGQPAPKAPMPIVEAACTTSPWRYALVGSLYTTVENVTRTELITAWNAGAIAATDDTKRALGLTGGVALVGRPELAPDRWAVVPAHELQLHANDFAAGAPRHVVRSARAGAGQQPPVVPDCDRP
jgi:hypothetical protein